MLAVISDWPKRPWYSLLLQMSVRAPRLLLMRPDLQFQGPVMNPGPERLKLADWILKGRDSLNMGCSAEVVQTLMKARMCSINSIYKRVWWKFQEYALCQTSSLRWQPSPESAAHLFLGQEISPLDMGRTLKSNSDRYSDCLFVNPD